VTGDVIVRARAYLRAHGVDPDPMPQDPRAAVEQLFAQVLDVSEAGHPRPLSGPFATERDAQQAAVQYTGPPGASLTGPPGQLAEANRSMLLDAVNAAGVELGDYDRRILDWLAGYEPSTCAVIAALIARAAERGQ
jgi:hypothetical protein